jgi:hypothetical protein
LISLKLKNRTELKQKKTEPNRKNWSKPVWTGFCSKITEPNRNQSVWTGSGSVEKKTGLVPFFYKNQSNPKIICNYFFRATLVLFLTKPQVTPRLFTFFNFADGLWQFHCMRNPAKSVWSSTFPGRCHLRSLLLLYWECKPRNLGVMRLQLYGMSHAKFTRLRISFPCLSMQGSFHYTLKKPSPSPDSLNNTCYCQYSPSCSMGLHISPDSYLQLRELMRFWLNQTLSCLVQWNKLLECRVIVFSKRGFMVMSESIFFI